MSIVFDHTIVPSRDKQRSAKFYEEVLGFENIGENDQGLLGLRINETSILFLEQSNDPESSPWSKGVHHYAFAMSRGDFDSAFSRIKSHGVPYGDTYQDPRNMRGPDRKAPGARGEGKSLYFNDPSDNLLQIMTYE